VFDQGFTGETEVCLQLVLGQFSVVSEYSVSGVGGSDRIGFSSSGYESKYEIIDIRSDTDFSNYRTEGCIA
jgi:hypothetical protein